MNDVTSESSYKNSGVDIKAASKLSNHIKICASQTKRQGVIGNIGNFASLFELPTAKYQQPVLVSSTDGVGTKLKFANKFNMHSTIGIDLVAMCVNDIICLGAEPLFFLDYYATGKLSIHTAQEIISGIIKGCTIANIALIGGETAEMPGIYHNSDYDLAGFCVGIAEKKLLINKNNVNSGNAVIAIASSGLHSNGFSLVRNIIEKTRPSFSDTFTKDKTLTEILLAPTKIYVNSILNVISKVTVNGIAHITGGGLIENIPRILPANTRAYLNNSSWKWPKIFQWLQEHGNVSITEMHNTFNLGIGMIIIIPKEDITQTLTILRDSGEVAWHIGNIATSKNSQPDVVIA